MHPARLPHAASLLLLTALLHAPGARADEHPIARIAYRPAADTTGCPDEQELRNAVSGRLGYDPFRADAPRLVEVDIVSQGHGAHPSHGARERRGLKAHVELRDATGKSAGSRDIASERNDCGELASALTLAISIAIDPLTLTRAPPPPTPPTPPPAQCPVAPVCPPQLACPPAPVCPPPPAPTAPPPTRALALRLGAHALASVGSSPATVAFGFSARAGVRIASAFSLSIEGRGDLTARADTLVVGSSSLGAETSLILGALVPCFHWRWLATCAVVGAGVLRATATNVTDPIQDQSLLVVAGVRLALEIPLYRWLALSLSVDGLAHLTPAVLRLGDGRELWRMGPLSLPVGLGLSGNFL